MPIETSLDKFVAFDDDLTLVIMITINYVITNPLNDNKFAITKYHDVCY